MKYKLIISDFDGTLARDDRSFSQRTIDTIRKYEAAGGKFCIATGRMLSSILNAIEGNGFKGDIIAYQGAVAADIESKKIFFESGINYRTASKIAKMLEENGDYIQAYFNDSFFVEKYVEQTKKYEELCLVKANVAGKKLSEFILESKKPQHKLLIISSRERTSGLYKTLPPLLPKNICVTYSNPFYLEIVNVNTTKANAVKMLAKRYNVKKSEIIAIGDSGNDIAMLDCAGMPVAMLNAPDEVKKHAKFITKSNNDDGVAHTIQKLCF